MIADLSVSMKSHRPVERREGSQVLPISLNKAQ